MDLDAHTVSPVHILALLDSAERARAGRFRFGRDRARFILRRGVLRTVLASRLGCDPAALRFTRNAFGKPVLDGIGLRFNASHSHGVALYAVAQDDESGAELGCDIERRDERTDIDGVARSLFAPGEVKALTRLPPENRRDGFFRCWTRKEAYVKALGLGLSHSLSSFDVLTPGDGPPGWSIQSFKPQPFFHAAVASQGEAMELILHPPRRTAATGRQAVPSPHLGHGLGLATASTPLVNGVLD